MQDSELPKGGTKVGGAGNARAAWCAVLVCACLGAAAQMHRNTDPLGQSTDNGETHAAGHLQAVGGRFLQEQIEGRELFLIEAGTTIDDLETVRAIGIGDAEHIGNRSGWGTLGSVLHQLGQQMCKVQGDVTGNRNLVEGDRDNSAVVLDFTDGNTDHFSQIDRSSPTTCLGVSSEYEERLSVAAHASRKVVDAIHLAEPIRIALLSLEFVDDLQLAIDQGLVAASHVHEHVGDAALQRLCLFLADLVGAFANLVQTALEVGEFVASSDLDVRAVGFARDGLAGTK